MLVKFLKPYSIFSAGETADMAKSKAATLKEQGIITDDPLAIRKKETVAPKKVKAVVPSPEPETAK